MGAWRVLDCSRETGSLANRRGQLVICTDRGETVVPYADIAVILVGQGWSVSGAVLAQLSEYSAALLVMDWKGVPLCACHGWAQTTRVGARHRSQADLSLPRKKNAWAQIVREKIRSQARALALLHCDGAEELYDMIKEVRSGDPGNLEAIAARWYWRHLFADLEFVREPGGADRTVGDAAQVNGCLDYGYIVLRGHGIRAVMAAGLAPSLGLFHRGRSNYFNLVDDLIEPFRPLIDHAVVSLGVRANLDFPATRHALVNAASAPFSGYGRSAATELELLAQRLGNYVEGTAERLEVTPWTADPLIYGVETLETGDF